MQHLSHEMRFDRQKLISKIAIFEVSIATLSHEMRFDRQNCGKSSCDFEVFLATSFARNEVRSLGRGRQKLRSKIAILTCPLQPFRTK